MSTPQNTTAYIETPISTLPEEDGIYLMMYPDGIFSNQMYMFQNGNWARRVNESKYSHWLRPVNLSRMLEDCWKAALERADMGDWVQIEEDAPPPDKEAYINSIFKPK